MTEMKAVYLPCNVGDIVYVKCAGIRHPGTRRVTDIHIREDGIIVTVRNDRTGETNKYFTWQFGREVFTILAEAASALADEGNGE